MHSAKPTTANMMRWIGSVLFLFFCNIIQAQENSPYSRYGLGDVAPNQNIVNRAMGGIAAGYSDLQSVNFINPASYANLSYVKDPRYLRSAIRNAIFDVGAEYDNRTLKALNPPAKFSSTNLLFSYIQMGLPVKLNKLNRKGVFVGMNFGLKPVSKINYRIVQNKRLDGVDTLAYIYEGTGGLNEANIGLAVRIKKFNIGFNAGYRFGQKEYSTKVGFLNDTVNYYQSNTANKTNFGGFFINLGAQYEFTMNNKSILRVGAYGNLKQSINASQKQIVETFSSDVSGNIFRIDSVFEKTTDGKIEYPASIAVGFTYLDRNNHWLFGVDFEQTYWNKYSFLGQKDFVQNNWKIRAGAEYFPASTNTPAKKYFNFVRYRAGFYYGPNYVNIGTNLPEYGLSFGAGFPLKVRRGYYETQLSFLNTSFEIGTRGTNSSSLSESIFRICVGFSLGDLWFNRSKYN